MHGEKISAAGDPWSYGKRTAAREGKQEKEKQKPSRKPFGEGVAQSENIIFRVVHIASGKG
jgi:hypothetical protein